jgi:hypothetical protein
MQRAGVIGCTLLWRPAQPSDVADYIANRRAVEAQRLLEDPIRGMTAKEKAQLDAESRAGDEKLMRYIGLVQHLNAGGWKSDFLTVTGQADACGDGFEFRLHIRQMRLETAFVTNISSEQLSVGGLIGDVEPGTSLRVSAPPAPGAAAEPLLGQAITLAPGDKIAVPLRILFVPAGGRDAVFQTDYLSGVQSRRRWTRLSGDSIGKAGDDIHDEARHRRAKPHQEDARELRSAERARCGRFHLGAGDQSPRRDVERAAHRL